MSDNLNSLLRAVRGEARREEQARLVDMLRSRARYDEESAARFHKRPAMSSQGRRASHLQYAAQLIEQNGIADRELTAGQLHAVVATDCDTVELYWYDPEPGDQDDEEEPMPIRVVVCDGADLVTASAYLDIDGAELLLSQLQELVTRRRAARQARNPSARGGTR